MSNEKPEIFRVSALVRNFLVKALEAESKEFVASLHYPLWKLLESKDKLLLEIRWNESPMRDDLDDNVLFVDRSYFFFSRMVDFLNRVPVKNYRSA
jgi:hypothetical protein